jgi:hypothetical protein
MEFGFRRSPAREMPDPDPESQRKHLISYSTSMTVLFVRLTAES